jgi:chaperone BCS1
MSLTL